MKRICFLILCTTITLLAAAQEKVIESSAKKSPDWIGANGGGFFTVAATDATLEGAQHKCMEDIKLHIITSVAANIVSDESSFSGQINRNGVFDLLENYSSSVKTQGASLPFLTNISISRAQATYWVKYQNKKDKSTYYKYYIKYPFSEFERRDLVDEFIRIDNTQYEKLQKVKANFDTFSSIEYIDQAIEELNPLIAYFFDNRRSNEAKSLQTLYRKQYENISLMPMTETLGEFAYCLMLNGRMITTSKKANLKSNCSTDLKVVPSQNGYSLTYNPEYCRADEDNSVEIGYVFGGKALKYDLIFNVRQDKLQVIPQGVVSLVANDDESVTVNIALRSKYDTSFVVENVTFSLPDYKEQIESGAIDKEFNGAGTYTLSFRCNKPLTELPDMRLILTKGVIVLKNLKTGIKTELLLQLPYEFKK